MNKDYYFIGLFSGIVITEFEHSGIIIAIFVATMLTGIAVGILYLFELIKKS